MKARPIENFGDEGDDISLFYGFQDPEKFKFHLPGKHDQSTHGRGGPAKLKYKDPPSPKGAAGGSAGGFSANGRTNTEVGDTAEAALQQLGLKDAHPGRRQGPLDVTCCGGYGFEVKALTTDAAEYKVKMKAHEKESKIRYAKEHGLKPATMIVVMDYSAGKAQAYWRDGIGNFRLASGSKKSAKEWNYMGEVNIE